MKEINQPVVRSLARVVEWELNPRRGVYGGMPEMVESLKMHGLQDAIHVWERTDGDYLLKGHRRTRGMKELGWTECLQVVHRFADERAAYAFLLEDHGHTVPLGPEEKIVAMETGVDLGMTTAELAPMMGVTEKTAQLWFDLGKLLPTGARSALAKGGLSLNTAELLLDIEDPKKRREAAGFILNDPETGEPMAHGQARAFILARYVLPDKWHKEWLALTERLKKKKKVVDGYQYVEWKDRLEFVQGDSGQPQPEFELGESFYPKDAEGRNWESVAVGLQVPVYVCAAPRHAEGFVTLVNAAMMRDARSVLGAVSAGGGFPEGGHSGGPDPVGEASSEDAGGGQVGAAPVVSTAVASADSSVNDKITAADAESERLRLWLRTWLGAIYEHLMAHPTDGMTYAPWQPLYAFLAHLTTDVDAGALEAWRGITTREEALAFMNGDARNRAPLRLAILMLLCAESDASDKPEKVIREVAAALDLDAGKLDAAVEAAAGK